MAAAAFIVWHFCSPSAVGGTKSVTVEITHLNGESFEETYVTETAYLWDLMAENALIDGTDSEYGKWVTTVDGETADETNGEYWVFTRNGEFVEYACDKTVIKDGEHYEFYIFLA